MKKRFNINGLISVADTCLDEKLFVSYDGFYKYYHHITNDFNFYYSTEFISDNNYRFSILPKNNLKNLMIKKALLPDLAESPTEEQIVRFRDHFGNDFLQEGTILVSLDD